MLYQDVIFANNNLRQAIARGSADTRIKTNQHRLYLALKIEFTITNYKK